MIPIFTMIGSLVTEWFEGRRQVNQAKIETKKAAEANKARLLSDQQSHNSAWEMASLAETDKPIRRLSFICFTAPFIIAIFAPEAVKNYFTVAIAAIPEWYKGTYMAITGSVWGISALKDPVSQIISNIKRKF